MQRLGARMYPGTQLFYRDQRKRGGRPPLSTFRVESGAYLIALSVIAVV